MMENNPHACGVDDIGLLLSTQPDTPSVLRMMMTL